MEYINEVSGIAGEHHIMLDLETAGTAQDAPIIAIGACMFDSTQIHGRYYVPVSLKSQPQRPISSSTFLWWLQQEDAARAKFRDNDQAMPLDRALSDFAAWVGAAGHFKTRRVWGNCATFDNAILQHAYQSLGINTPWPFWGDRSFRTMKGEFPRQLEPVFKGVPHYALDDALHQAKWLQSIWEYQRNAVEMAVATGNFEDIE